MSFLLLFAKSVTQTDGLWRRTIDWYAFAGKVHFLIMLCLTLEYMTLSSVPYACDNE